MKKIFFLLFISILISSCAMFRPSGRTSEELKEEIQDLLKEHPELVLDVLRQNNTAVHQIVLQGELANHEIQRQKLWESELKNPFQPKIDPDRPALGYSKAPIVIVSYSDFLCSHCKDGAEIVTTLLKNHPKKLRLINKHNLQFNNSVLIALYFEAIGNQSPIQAWKFHDMVFENQDLVGQEGEKALKDIVSTLKINKSKLAEDIKSPKLAKRIESDIKEAKAFGLSGTPNYLINGVAIRGLEPIEIFEKVIDMVENNQQ